MSIFKQLLFIRSVLAVNATILLISPALPVSALTVAPPPELSGREKAHRNIIFTGGGSDITPGQSCSVGDSRIGTVSKDFNLGSDPKERRINLIKAFMAAYGLSPEQAAGPVGNFMQESGGLHIPPDVNQNDTTGAPPNSSDLGYGWAQWSGGRKTQFVAFMREKGYVTGDGRATDAANFGYLTKELDSPTYASTIVELKKQTSPEQAAISFEATFERAGNPVMENRKKYARQAFSEYKTANLDNEGSSTAGCGTASSQSFGEVAFPLKGSKDVVLNPGIFKNGTTEVGGHPYIAYDIYARQGTETVAFASGTVTYTSVDRCGGKFLTIWNEQAKLGITYMHLSDHIGMGKKVKPGDHVGTIGSSVAGCGTEHLHIDAATDKQRQGCSRLDCSIESHFKSIGKELFVTYQALAD